MKKFLILFVAWLVLAAPAWATRLLTTGLEENDGTYGTLTAFNSRSSLVTYSSTWKHSGNYSLKMTSASASNIYVILAIQESQ